MTDDISRVGQVTTDMLPDDISRVGQVTTDMLPDVISRVGQVTIDMLPDDVFVEIFDFYMNKAKRIEAWCTLVHVCRRWRTVVFASPRRLNLRLLCTERTPVKEMLDVWPALPIKVCNVGGPMSLAGGADDIIAALEHNDRVCEISLWGVPSWLLGSLCAAMEDPFVELTDLFLWPNNESFLPDSFLGGSAPRLRSLDLNSVAFPALGNLLLSASHHLVNLRLRNVPAAGYVSPEEMVTCLSAMPGLEIFQLEFQSPRSRPDRADRRLPALSPALTRAILPALTEFAFQGVSRYLEDLVARIDAPQLRDVAITLVKQLIFSTPQFLQFIGRLETFKGLNRAEVTFSRRSVAITLSRPLSPQTGQQRRRRGTGTKNVDVVDLRTLTLRIFSESDGQISSLAQVCRSSLPPPLSIVERLDVCEDRDWRPRWRDDVEITQWLELLRPFTGVKDLYLSEGIVRRVAPALQGHVGEGVTDVLPALRSVFLQGLEPSGPIQESQVIGQFLAAREVSGHPVAVYDWERDAREVGD
jgi:hypothetical protein